MKRVVLFFCMMMSAIIVMAKDVKTVVFTTTPQMHCENCENKIKKNMRFEKGVKLIETSIPNQTVKITYDSDKTSPAGLIKGFKKIGYEARQVKEGEKVKKNEGEVCPNM